MRILLTGGTGQIGWELRRTLAPLGEVTAPSRTELDLRDPDALRAAVRDLAPGLVVNAAAWTDVDGAEEAPEAARAVNARAPGVLAEAAAESGALLVHYSTDYVFDGEKGAPYTEGDAPAPLNVYGRTKLAGEEAVRASGADHLTLRTSWVYGLRRPSFLTAMLRLFREEREVRVVDDQVGSPTWCRLVAEGTAGILSRVLAPTEGAGRPAPGTYHLASAGETSWHGFAEAIRREVSGGGGTGGDRGSESARAYSESSRDDEEPGGAEARKWKVERIVPVSSDEFPRPADRPARSTLDASKARRAFGVSLPLWERGLALCLEERAGGPAPPIRDRPGTG